ncbi:MAG TPA: glycosyltransferase family 39 protein [Thermoanaerobaculia bacterium]
MNVSDIGPRIARRAGLLIFLLALAARLATIAYFGGTTLRFGDARAYLSVAESLARTGHYPRQTDYFSFRAPGYPIFLLAATLGHPERIAAGKIANAVLGALSALLLSALAARIFHSRGVAIAAGLVGALDPGLVLMTADIQSEPLFILLILAAAFLLLSASDRPSSNLAVLSGLFLAFAALTRPFALILAPLLAAPLGDRRYPLRARGHLAASAVLGFLLGLTPWTIRNALVYRELVPVNDFAGINLYIGNSDLMDRFYRVRTRAEYDAWIKDLDRLTRDRFAELQESGEMSPARRTGAFVRMTLAERRARPDRTLPLLFHKTWDWLRPYPSPLFWPPWVVWATGLLYGALMLLAVIGGIASPRRGVLFFTIAYLALTMAAHIAFLVVWRYRLACWNPALILYGVFGASLLLGQGSADRRAVPSDTTSRS